MTDDRRAQASGIARRHPASEKQPGVRTVAGAGNLKGDRRPKLVTRLDESPRVLPPVGLVEIDGEEMAGVVGQQRIDADRVPAGQVAVDDRIRQRDQQAVGTVRTLDARLLADTGTPFVGTGRCVTRLAGGLAFPADGVSIRAAPEQAAKQRHFFCRREP